MKFDRVSLRYFLDLDADQVLNERDWRLHIVSRTGADKSKLINALFRLSFNEGSIVIDGRNTLAMGLHDLRRKMSIILQEPVFFSGTRCYNLDPFDELELDENLSVGPEAGETETDVMVASSRVVTNSRWCAWRARSGN